MKKFFLNLLSSFLGTWIAFLFVGLVIFIIAGAIIFKAGVSGVSDGLKKNSVLVLELKGDIIESEKALNLNFKDILKGDVKNSQALDVIVNALKEAANDKRVEALYIKCDGLNAQPATINAIRNAVVEFKKSKKKILAYGDFISEGEYYIASVADSIYLNPQGNFSLTGISQKVLYLGDLFKKIGVNFQIARVGTYKSAVEPFTMNEMSEPARRQLEDLNSSLWSEIKSGISSSRGIDASGIDSLTNSIMLFRMPEELKKSKLFSGFCYEHEMDSKFAVLLGVEKKNINFINPKQIVSSNSINLNYSEDHIAVLYACGDIAETSDAGINCHNLVPVIMDLTEDEHVKGLVLRVNSPGGSVFGSEQIAEALKKFKASGKPFSVSMGDYAASGGYWISCDADRIFANPMTITGSIGIFGIIPDLTPLMTKFGISLQDVSTNPAASIGIPLKPLTPEQMEAFQQSISKGYDKFIKRVANGRKLPETKVREIAEGRIWSGKDALKLGLVDQLGYIKDAIEWTANKASLSSDNVAFYPVGDPSFINILLQNSDIPVLNLIKSKTGSEIDMFTLFWIAKIANRYPLQARMPDISVSL